MKESRWGSYLDQLIRVDELSRGYLFEAYVLHIFRYGGHIFEIKELFGQCQQGTLKIPKNPSIHNFRQPKDLNIRPTGNDLLLPSVPNFPCIDLVLGPNKLIQVTTTKDHPLKQSHLEQIANNALARNPQVDCYNLRDWNLGTWET